MLQSLHVKNLALIEEVNVEFDKGLNILTGETGAGKSIIIGSINMALGEKVQKDMISSGKEYALLELVFEMQQEEKIDKLKEMGIFPEDDQIIITRRITDTKTISKINGELVPASKIKEIAPLLINIHGQHENETLLKKKSHLKMLDDYGKDKVLDLKKELKQLYSAYEKVIKEIAQMEEDEQMRNRELDLLEFEIEEIESGNLKEQEDIELEERFKVLSNMNKILEGISAIEGELSKAEPSISTKVSMSLKQIQQIENYDSRISQWKEQLCTIEDLVFQLEKELADYSDQLELDQEELYEVENRLDFINQLKYKYGNSIEKILESYQEKCDRRDYLVHFQEHKDALEKKKSQLEVELKEKAEILSEIRKELSGVLTKEVKKHLIDLNFNQVVFEMQFTKLSNVTSNGMDEVEFYISMNPGEEKRPLHQVASGGELSRIMLAFKTAFAGNDGTETLIFDEIDAGISGRTAQKVSEKMHLIGKEHQVICITHLPQIAAMSDCHFLIEKTSENDKTQTMIQKLNHKESVLELARMLSGAEITDSVIENAREMKELAKRDRNS